MSRTRLLVILTTVAGIAALAAGVFFNHSANYLAGASLALAVASVVAFGFVASRPQAHGATTKADDVPAERLDGDLLFEFASSRLDLQRGTIDSVDAKTGVIFSVGSAEIGALAAFLALGKSTTPGEVVLLAVGFATYVVLAGISARGLWSRIWFQGPVVAEVVEAYRTQSKEVVRLAVAQSMIKAFDDNENSVADKVLGLKIVIVALIVQTVALIAEVPLVS